MKCVRPYYQTLHTWHKAFAVLAKCLIVLLHNLEPNITSQTCQALGCAYKIHKFHSFQSIYCTCIQHNTNPSNQTTTSPNHHLPIRTTSSSHFITWYALNSVLTRQPLSYARVCLSFWNSVLIRGIPLSQLSSRSSSVRRLTRTRSSQTSQTDYQQVVH